MVYLNCSEIPNFPYIYIHCSYIDNLLTIIVFWPEAAFLAYFAYVMGKRIYTSSSEDIFQAKFIRAIIFILCVTTIGSEGYVVFWLLEVIPIPRGLSRMGTVLLVQSALFSSIISTKASTLVVLLRDSSKFKITRGFSALNYVALVISVIDPLLIIIYTMFMSPSRLWIVAPWQSMTVCGFNTLMIIVMVHFSRQVRTTRAATSGSGTTSTKQISPIDNLKTEIYVLQVWDIVRSVTEYYNSNMGLKTPQLTWSTLLALRMVPVYYFYRRGRRNNTKKRNGTASKNSTQVRVSPTTTIQSIGGTGN